MVRLREKKRPHASRVKSGIRMLWLAACIMAVVTPRLSAEITLVSRLSDARAYAYGGGVDDAPPPRIQTDFLPANLFNSATAPAAKGGIGADASCTSNSEIVADNSMGTLRVTGGGGGHVTAFVSHANAQASAKLVVLNFTLTNTSYSYSITGQLTGPGGCNLSSCSMATAKLTSGSGTIFEVVGTTLSKTGTLPPGTYTLSVDFTASIDFGAASAQAIGFYSSASANFNFALDPAPSEPTATPGPTGTPCPLLLLSENFDGVTAPALPAGWTTVATGAEGPWVTSTAHPVSDPNSVFGPAVPNVGNTELISPMVAVPAAGGVLAFQNLFNLQPHESNPAIGRDGMVLEISINGGAFVDIIAAGGTFGFGGYTHTISTEFMSPIAGRMAWSGLSAGSTVSPNPIVSVVTLPAAAGGQNIQLKWRVATDNGIIAGAGVNIDDIAIVGAECGVPTPTPTPETSCAPVITQSSSQAITPGSFSCNGGPPNFINFGNSYWRAFDMASVTGGQTFYVTGISFGIERAVSQSLQFVDVRLYRQTSGAFPGGTRTQIGFVSLDLAPDLKGVIAGAPLDATVPAGTTELIMEVSTSGSSGSSSFFIGANAAPQTGPSYISAPACGLTNPTDLATIGYPDMHIVLNVHGFWFCPGGPTVTPTPTPTPTPTATATVTPTPTPTPTPGEVARAVNLSTRLLVGTGNNVGIGGFIVTGTSPKRVLLRGIGPSLGGFGVPNPLADPFLELRNASGALIASSDDWCTTNTPPICLSCCDQIIATGIPPTNDLESAILATLDPGAYTAILSGKNNGTGIGLVEVYDVGQAAASKLANISTRAFVSTGSDMVIAGFILGGGSSNDLVVIRGLGPSLAASGLSPVLADPTLELHDGNGTLLISNNNWQDDPTGVIGVILTSYGLAPTNTLESAIAATLPPGFYTALLSGVNNGTGLGLVEVYDLGSQ